jgi:hypothetical protein
MLGVRRSGVAALVAMVAALATACVLAVPVHAQGDGVTHEFAGKWRSLGTGDGEFNSLISLGQAEN